MAVSQAERDEVHETAKAALNAAIQLMLVVDETHHNRQMGRPDSDELGKRGCNAIRAAWDACKNSRDLGAEVFGCFSESPVVRNGDTYRSEHAVVLYFCQVTALVVWRAVDKLGSETFIYRDHVLTDRWSAGIAEIERYQFNYDMGWPYRMELEAKFAGVATDKSPEEVNRDDRTDSELNEILVLFLAQQKEAGIRVSREMARRHLRCGVRRFDDNRLPAWTAYQRLMKLQDAKTDAKTAPSAATYEPKIHDAIADRRAERKSVLDELIEEESQHEFDRDAVIEKLKAEQAADASSDSQPRRRKRSQSRGRI
jgi:hypothetical protein